MVLWVFVGSMLSYNTFLNNVQMHRLLYAIVVHMQQRFSHAETHITVSMVVTGRPIGYSFKSPFGCAAFRFVQMRTKGPNVLFYLIF